MTANSPQDDNRQTTLPPMLTNQVCLVTGASRTLGAEIASTLARSGAAVALNYHQSEAAAQALYDDLTAAGYRVLPIQADVSQPDQVEALIKTTEAELGPIDVVVNNVGPYVDEPFIRLSVADFDHILAGNVRATFLVSQTAGRLMKARGHGRIINIAATDAFHRSHSIYGLAKAGVIYLTEAMALELAPEVQVNAIAPDLIADNEGMAPNFVSRSVAGTPLGRLVTRSEVAEMVYRFCLPPFDIVTGQTLVMDGGRTLPRISFGPTDTSPASSA
jgi:NAD(P)-dependent dehydrogenase (short-subunit alcohol dehydrogenase family)